MLSAEDTAPLERVDAIVGCEQLDMALAEELLALAPFGRGNPGVSLLVEDAAFRDLRPMGEGKHLRFTVESGGGEDGSGARARGVAFGTGAHLPVAEGEPAEATFTLEINDYNGVTEPRLLLRQVRSAEEALEIQELPGDPVMAPVQARALKSPAAPQENVPHEELVLFA